MTMEAERSSDAHPAAPGVDDTFADDLASFGADDFALPDFLDLAGITPDADFGAASRSSVADGGILVFPTAVLVICGEQQDRIPLDDVTGWSVADENATFTVTIDTAAEHFPARLPSSFRAPTVSALEAALGPAGNTA